MAPQPLASAASGVSRLCLTYPDFPVHLHTTTIERIRRGEAKLSVVPKCDVKEKSDDENKTKTGRGVMKDERIFLIVSHDR